MSLTAADAAIAAHNAILFSGASSGGGGGGGATTLTAATINEEGNTTQTFIPVELFIPFSDSTGTKSFASTDAVQILDTDGVTPLLVQEDNTSNDLNSEIRGKLVTALLPSLTALQARALTVQKLANTSPATGTAITVAEVLAAASSDCIATMVHKNGTTYTAAMSTALNGSAWSNETTAANTGKWRDGANGGLADEWIASCPFKNGGSSAPNDLRFHLSVSAYKAQRGAVSGGNPIIGVKIKYWIEGSYVEVNGTQTNDWYDLTVTAGSNTQSWVGSTPAKTLTLGTNGGNDTVTTATVPTGGTTFPANCNGMAISDGTGVAVIIGRVSADQVWIRIVNTMSGTSISSGNWRLWGVAHGWAQAFTQQEIWYGGTPAISARPIHAHLGTAWNGSTGGPMQYFIDTGMILPYAVALSDTTNDMTLLNACGTHPMSTCRASYPGGLSQAGDVRQSMPNTGGREDIAPVPGWFVGALKRWDTNARRVIMENGGKCAQIPWQWRSKSTGKSPQFNNGTNFVIDRAWGSYPSLLPQPDSYHSSGAVETMTGWEPQDAHHPDLQFVPWLLTGDFFWVEQRHKQIFWTWSANNPGFWGSQMNRMFCLSSELRGNAWNLRDGWLGILMTPTRNPAPLSYTRSHLKTLMDNQFTATNSGVSGTSPFPGINLGVIANTGSGKNYNSSGGIRGMTQGVTSGSGGAVESFFPMGYLMFALCHIKAAGMMSSDMSTWMTWLSEGITGQAVNASVKANWLVPAYRFVLTDHATNTYQNDWANIYRNTAMNPTQVGNAKRVVTGTGITLSALKGSGITVTMPAGYFTTGQSFYEGSPVIDLKTACFGSDVLFGSSVTSITWSGGTAHVTLADDHHLPGATTLGNITISGASPSGYNGTYQPRSTGAKTFDYDIADPGSPTASGTMRFYCGTPGTGYANGDTVDLTINDSGGKFSVTRRARLTLTVSGGVITGYTITDAGLYVANTVNDKGDWGQSASQFSTSGSGTGLTFTNLQYWIGWGCGMVTAVSGNQLTLTTVGVFTGDASTPIWCNGFAQTGLTTNAIQVGAPYPGDSDGSSALGLTPSMPNPQTGYVEYYDIAKQCNYMMSVQGFPNGAAAYAAVNAIYTGSSERKWKVS